MLVGFLNNFVKIPADSVIYTCKNLKTITTMKKLSKIARKTIGFILALIGMAAFSALDSDVSFLGTLAIILVGLIGTIAGFGLWFVGKPVESVN